MDCNVIKDLIPLYVDGCCSEESKRIVQEHINNCHDCKKLLEDMQLPTDIVTVSESPKTFRKLNDWKASVLQSLLLFLPFGLITIGVWLEANNSGFLNGFWAFNLVIPATGFMLSLANWYFVRVYNSRESFSRSCLFTNLGITVCGYIFACFHYELDFIDLFVSEGFFRGVGMLLQAGFHLNGIGILLTVVFCTLSKTLSNQYAKMLGKE